VFASSVVKHRSFRLNQISNHSSVNEIFDPDRVLQIFSLPPELRAAAISQDKSTNYSVVRLELLEHIYEKLYMQRLDEPDPKKWRCQIIPNRIIQHAAQSDTDSRLRLKLADSRNFGSDPGAANPHRLEDEFLDVDYVFVATGYTHDAHESILAPVERLVSISDAPQPKSTQARFPVDRDYRLTLNDDQVDRKQAGIWLQGCNESTHGVRSR
jgi:L-ornithine N5-oxygenase